MATDFERGGIALYRGEDAEGIRIIVGRWVSCTSVASVSMSSSTDWSIMRKGCCQAQLLPPRRVLIGMGSFWQFFEAHLRSLPESWGTDEALTANEVPNPTRRRFELEFGGSPRQQMQEAMQQLVGLYNGLGDVANLDDLHGFSELNPWPEHVALRHPPYSPVLPSHGTPEPGQACPSYIT